MPLTVPALDNRRYQQLLDEALARIPVHTPEWTNFNKSDPGVTLIEIFAFLAESLLYRSNLIPERNRIKFLNLLGVPLAPGQAARGFVTITNERGPKQTITLNDDLEVRAGQTPFRSELGLDVLPIEARVFYKRRKQDVEASVQEYYRQLYASYIGAQPVRTAEALIYETAPFSSPAEGGVTLSQTVDGALWIALLLRPGDRPYDDSQKREASEAIANRVLSLGMLPIATDQSGRTLSPVGQAAQETAALLRYEIPDLPDGGMLPTRASDRIPRYKALQAVATADVLAEPGIVQIRLPSAPELALWSNVDPLEMGVGEFPPALEDTALSDRLLTWLRITSSAALQARFLWVGANATFVSQRARMANELLPPGSGEPDQVLMLSQPPVIPGSVRLTVTPPGQSTEAWEPIDDLFAAGPEVPVRDPRLPPGAVLPPAAPTKVFALDPEAGAIRFGDGSHGTRPPFGAVLRVDYDHGMGAAGNVGAGAINSAPALPAGLQVTNPAPTWGGADSETVLAGEKQVTRYLQHRDRLVTAADFETIAYRTPGVDVGRVEVLPAYSPELGPNAAGDAAGAVTLLLVPRYDPAHPIAPVPDRLFLDAVCAYLNPRRLVTTEVFLRGPSYRPIWVSIGITTAPRASLAQVGEAVKTAVQQFMSPLPAPGVAFGDAPQPLLAQSVLPDAGQQGWPLSKPVLKLEIAAVANRVAGVLLVNSVLLFDDQRNPQESILMNGLELPRLDGIVVGLGEAPPASAIPGFGDGAATGAAGSSFVPVPAIPEECR